ncbi:hypothetical protein DM02DRAFT_629990 [Periconia macrospinosa]|uniref:Uncharacterized protein n=1 Tax=Periconia macrospinosa TaxID=97972 RepID=A0A2V1DKI7_9PLEO|nr:hypothetical protein DM02DRAFT_629990 [Periconia macrospinosa]
MQGGSRRRGSNDDLWHSMGGSRWSEERREEPSAYQSTSAQHSPLRGTFAQVPVISTSAADRSPESQRRKNKPASLRSLLSRRSSAEPNDVAHLQPTASHSHYRSSSRDGKLVPEPLFSVRSSPRSMPNSPRGVSTNEMSRAQSASPTYHNQTQYQAYSLNPPTSQFPQRSTSMGTYFDPNSHSYPDVRSSTAAPRTRTQPETEPFNDDNEFHLFAEAMSGLPDNFDAMSPSEAPRLQASLFARGNLNDTIPLPLMDSSAFERWDSSPNEYGSRQQPRERAASRPEYVTREVIPIPSMDDEWDPQRRSREIIAPSSVAVGSNQWTSHRQSSSISMYNSALPGIDSYEQPSSFDTPPLSSVFPPPSVSAFPRRASYDRPPTEPMPSNLVAVNMELERLGVEDEHPPDDELPNYQQSQAEMNERKRVEAAARARELESRWNSSRGYR